MCYCNFTEKGKFRPNRLLLSVCNETINCVLFPVPVLFGTEYRYHQLLGQRNKIINIPVLGLISSWFNFSFYVVCLFSVLHWQLLDLPREFHSLTSQKTLLRSAGRPLAPAWRATASPTSPSREVSNRQEQRGESLYNKREGRKGLLCWYPPLGSSLFSSNCWPGMWVHIQGPSSQPLSEQSVPHPMDKTCQGAQSSMLQWFYTWLGPCSQRSLFPLRLLSKDLFPNSLFCRHFVSQAYLKRWPLETIIIIYGCKSFPRQWFFLVLPNAVSFYPLCLF